MHAGVPQKIVLAGRTFVPVGESTLEHDIEVMRLLRVAGIDVRAGEAADETSEEFAWTALAMLFSTGTLLPLVACLILPEERSAHRAGILARWLERAGLLRREAVRGGWSPEVQAETTEFLKQLDEPRDKELVHNLVALHLLPFLIGVLGSWRPSRRSSGDQVETTPAAAKPSPSAGRTSAAGAG